ncbi:MAG: L-threonylcarbamoyladenylate synthase [Chloroflexota bacterium]
MNGEELRAEANVDESSDVEQAAAVIRRGGLVAFPTDTFYGLGADPFNREAVERLFRAKGRQPDQAVPLLLASDNELTQVAMEVPEEARALAEKFWPGALTLVLRKVERLPAIVTGGSDTVGVRVPDHRLPRALARAAGVPVTGTSANRSGFPPVKTAEEAQGQLGSSVDFYMQGECGAHSAPSTVIDFTRYPPEILRIGAVSVEELRQHCPSAVEA